MDNFNIYEIPLSSDEVTRSGQKKILSGDTQSLTNLERIRIGRDNVVREIDGYELRPDCAYRCVSVPVYEAYLTAGFVYGYDKNDEYDEGNNKGVNWYLGGASLKYGSVVLECPASKEYFILPKDNGNGMSKDPLVKFIKSSGYKNPVPMSMVRVIKHPSMDLEDENVIKR